MQPAQSMKKSIINVPVEKAFWFCNGKVAKNLKELASILEIIPQSDFQYHANLQKNDFAKWVSDVFAMKTLAKSIAKIKTAKEMAKTIKAGIK